MTPTPEQVEAADKFIEEWLSPSQRRAGVYSALASLLSSRESAAREKAVRECARVARGAPGAFVVGTTPQECEAIRAEQERIARAIEELSRGRT